MTSSPTLILKASHSAGFGDLIRALLVAIAYAQLSGRTLFVDWRGGLYGHPPDRNLFDDLFTLVAMSSTRVPPREGRTQPPRWRNALDKTFREVHGEDGERDWDRDEAIQIYSTDLHRLDYDEQHVVLWDFDQFHKLRPALAQSFDIPAELEEEAALSILWQRHLRLRPAIQEPLDLFWSQLPQRQRLIGMHVRQTQESTRARGLIPLRDYERALRRLRVDEQSLLFLATDHQQVQAHFEQRYPGRLISHPKWFASAGQALHQLNPSCPDPWQNIVSAMLDLLALSRCDVLLYPAWSSFSIVARIMGGFRADQVIALHSHHPHWMRRAGSSFARLLTART